MSEDVMIFKPQVEQAARKFGFLLRDDLVQEGYIALLENQERLFEVAGRDLKEAQDLASNLARNRMSNVLRKQRGRPIEVSLTDDMASVTPNFSSDNEELKLAMTGLEPTDRYILSEVFFHEKLVKDVAVALGWNVAKVKRRKALAIVQLRKIMGVS